MLFCLKTTLEREREREREKKKGEILSRPLTFSKIFFLFFLAQTEEEEDEERGRKKKAAQKRSPLYSKTQQQTSQTIMFQRAAAPPLSMRSSVQHHARPFAAQCNNKQRHQRAPAISMTRRRHHVVSASFSVSDITGPVNDTVKDLKSTEVRNFPQLSTHPPTLARALSTSEGEKRGEKKKKKKKKKTTVWRTGFDSIRVFFFFVRRRLWSWGRRLSSNRIRLFFPTERKCLVSISFLFFSFLSRGREGRGRFFFNF